MVMERLILILIKKKECIEIKGREKKSNENKRYLNWSNSV